MPEIIFVYNFGSSEMELGSVVRDRFLRQLAEKIEVKSQKPTPSDWIMLPIGHQARGPNVEFPMRVGW